MGMPRTGSITKSGRPESVAPRVGNLRDIRRIHPRQGQGGPGLAHPPEGTSRFPLALQLVSPPTLPSVSN